MQLPTKPKQAPSENYRPEQQLCPECQRILKRAHILWRKEITFSTGVKTIVSWAYRCPQRDCPGSQTNFASQMAERLHLKHRRFSRELIVKIGYRRFWHYQTMYALYDWLSQELQVTISDREIMHLVTDFLALLKAGQAARIRQKLSQLQQVIIAIDGMQPEKGNDCLYIVREVQSNLTLLAESLEESSHEALKQHLLQPLQRLVQELGLQWQGVVSDNQLALRLAVAQTLPGVVHQVCQSHCLREAGAVTFEADRALKKKLKAAFRQPLGRLRKQMQALPESEPGRSILLDYGHALRSTLLEGGVAPFELGGIQVFDALAAVEASLLRCQKKPTIVCYNA